MKKTLLFSLISILFLIGCSSKEIRPTLNPSWSEITLRAVGKGAPPNSTNGNIAQARLMACNAAKMDAYRQLIEQVYGVQVSSETYVKDYITKSDVIRSRAEGFVKKARIINEKESLDGACEVTLELFLGEEFYDILMN